ncbi:MAG: ABC transporter ATP-binding protein [Bacillota bacterium]
MDNEILRIKNLQKRFGNVEAVKNVNLKINKGDIFGFLGPNGAGKSTTIRMILGLVKPDNGNVVINGCSLKNNYKKALTKVGAMVETPSFYEFLTGYENLRLTANLYKDVKHVDILKVIKTVGLKKKANEKVKGYSVGMKQRLGIARALLNDPELIILDEPTSGLDPQGKKEIRKLITNLSETKNITFFICTHLLNEVEQICNRVAILQEGKIISNRLLSEDNENKWIKIYTKQKEEVNKLLKDYDGVRNIKISENAVEINIDSNEIENINTLLFSRNLKIKYIVPKVESLENYYFNKTGGKFDVI